ncbi:MAG: hypothetical protein AABY22_08800 [Nanoarchaeota archaeon]
MNQKQKAIEETAKRILSHILANARKNECEDNPEWLSLEIFDLCEYMNNSNESNRTVANEILKMYSFPPSTIEYVRRYFSGG